MRFEKRFCYAVVLRPFHNVYKARDVSGIWEISFFVEFRSRFEREWFINRPKPEEFRVKVPRRNKALRRLLWRINHGKSLPFRLISHEDLTHEYL